MNELPECWAGIHGDVYWRSQLLRTGMSPRDSIYRVSGDFRVYTRNTKSITSQSESCSGSAASRVTPKVVRLGGSHP